MEHRAYTAVDPGTARLGNAWLDRSWSAFMGQTIDLTHKPDGFSWLTGASPEIGFTLRDGRDFDVMALGEVEWSEECSPHAAGLLLRKGSPPGVGAFIRTLALHETAGLVREVRLFNTGPEPLTVASVRYEMLPLRGARQVLPEGVAVLADGRGLLIGVEGAAELTPGTPGGEALTISCNQPHTLARGDHWDLPPVFVLPFAGGLGAHVAALATSYHKHREAMRAWEAGRAAAIREEAENN